MSKKKRQGDPGNANESGDSTESGEECSRGTSSSCSHINKGVELGKIKKYLAKTAFLDACPDCGDDLPPPVESFYEYDTSLWMCLKCGNQACGRSINKHAIKHFETPHSDSHSLCINTSTWSVWCYDCDDEVNIVAKKKLLECVEYLKRYSETIKKRSESILGPIALNNTPDESRLNAIPDELVTNPMTPIVPKSTITASTPSMSTTSNLPKARGLSNLGNTCFFNSVMQCLGQTPYLLQLLEETAKPDQHFKLPGGKIHVDEIEEELEPLEGTLEEWRPLTKVLAETLQELQSGQQGVINPRVLHSRLIQRMPQFGGGDQHDSHELLRHLLEAVREEDLRRYQAVILEKLGFSKKTLPSSVEGDKKKIIKYYGSQASELLLPTEQVFRGVLISTLQCQDCEHTSHRDEYFLDLSLPISEKSTPPGLRRKAEEIEDKPSKYQIKKERKQAKKNKKSKPRQNDQASSANAENNSDSESDADVEDNIEDSSNNLNTPEDGPSKGTESGYNSDKNGSPDNISPDMCVDDSGVPSPTVGMLSVSPLGPGSPENSPASSETNIDMGSPLGGRMTPNDEINEEYDRPESRLSFVHCKTDIKADLEKLSLKNDSNKTLDINRRLDGAYVGFDYDEDDKMEVDADQSTWSGTMSNRYSIEEGECSVQSCLNQFTTSELMTANNKVSCELCTKRKGGPEKKTVYTNARKQLLIYNPPAVLILHLKRFQVYHFRPAKVSKNVKFPTMLDIAPFCSVRSRKLPTFHEGQSKVLYSLYGVVEHSGSMHGGHYVAYVKVRPKLAEDSYRWRFLPKNQKGESKWKPDPEEADVQSPPGKWFYISDSHAAEVSESRVLTANAYLLFYERLL